MEKRVLIPKISVYLMGILIFLGLYLTSLYSYLLFHSLAEIFSIVVAFGIFVIAWNSRRFLDNNYLLFVGIAYLFVGAIDLIHTLAYTGMGVFQGYGTNLPTQLWIAARYMESISLLIAPFLFRRKLKANFIIFGYALATAILLLSIFYWDVFPACFIEGVGLTSFKKISEYVISLILLASIVLLLKNRRELNRIVLQWVAWSIILTIASELAFTFYIDAYGLSNLIGHFFKILSFYLIYKAIIETGLTKPYALLFRSLKQSEERFRNIFAESPIGIELYDFNGKIVEVNKACLKIFGISDASQVKGPKLFEDPNLSQEVKERLKKGESVRYETPFDFEKVREYKLYPTTKSGTIYLDVLITPLGLRQKEAQTGYLVQVRDITERKQVEDAIKANEEHARDQAARLQAVLDTAPAIIWIARDRECRSISGNRTAHEFLRVPEGTDMSKSGSAPEHLAHYRVFKDGVELTPQEMPIQQVAASGQELSDYAMEIVFDDGSVRSVLGNINSVLDSEGHPNGAVAAFLDITERKWMEEELRKSHNELEIRVQERTAELEKLNEALQNEITERKQTEESLRKLTNELNERVKEINCLYSISYYISRQNLRLEEKLQSIADLIPSGWQYPEIACARIILEGKTYKTDNFKETLWKQASEIIVHDERIGTIEVYYLDEIPESDEGPFLKEERNLINTIAIELGEMIGYMQAEKSLLEQSRILEGFFTSTITPLVFLDRDFNFIRVNEAYAKACQRQVSEFPGHNHFEFYPSDAKAKFEQVVQTKEPYVAIAKPFTFPDHPEWGTSYWDWTLTPILDDTGEVEFLVFSLEDVTERKRAAEAVETERQRFNDVLEMLPAYLVLLAPDYHVPFANRFFRERFGESQGRRCFEYLFGRSEPCEVCETYTVLKTMAPHKWEWTGPDGHTYDVSDFPFTDADGSTLILEMGIDITERKEAEKALQKHMQMLDLANDSIVIFDLNDRIIYWNQGAERLYGWKREEALGQQIHMLLKAVYPVPLEDIKESLYGRRHIEMELVYTKKDGTKVSVESRWTLQQDETGRPIAFLEINNDVTERKRMEEELKVISLYARSLIEVSLDPLVTISADGKVMDVNKATELVTGVSRKDLIGSDFSDYFSEPDRAKKGYEKVFSEGFVKDYPLAIRHTSGHVIDVLYNATVYRNEAGEVQGVFAAARDITEYKRAEEALRESENRLRALSSQLLTVQENERRRISREIHDSLGQSLSAIKFKIENITHQMRDISYKKMLEPLLPIIQESIEESRRIQMDLRPSILDDLGIIATLTWFSREFQKIYSNIHVDKEIEIAENEVPDTLKTVIYRISQEALNNIAKHSQADSVRLSLKKATDRIELAIRDNGKGFDLEGTLLVDGSRKGLGLTSMRERTELSGGCFEIESTPGKGTTIKALWPT